MRDTRYEIGSALILAVVLTSLLAIIGVMFLMVARVDRMATSGISENKELNFAVETVIAKISQELVLDVPGAVDPNEEYYDYPDPCNAWLASLEPYEFGGIYYWQQITDLYRNNFGMPTYPPNYYDPDDYSTPAQWDSGQPAISNWYLVSPYNVVARIIADSENTGYTIIDRGDWNNNADLCPVGRRADADGDGVADSRWIRLPDMSSSKGKPIFSAIRIIDNGAMLNVNTIFADPNAGDKRKGDMLTDIYIDGLVKLGGDQIFKFIENRSGDPAITEVAAQQYHIEVSRRVENPAASNPPYTLYDISEELSLRNRFILHPNQTITRLEAGSALDPNRCLSTTLRWRGYGNAFRPYSEWASLSDAWNAWIRRFDPFDDANDPNSNNYDFRHLLTTYNMDRIINPLGLSLNNGKMVNVNTDGEALLYAAIWVGLYDAGVLDPNSLAAQMAVNIVDYRDADSDVTVYNGYYGFERPCIYISELAHNFMMPDPNDPNTVYRSYAIELYKPYFEDNDPCSWQLVIGSNPPIGINWSGTRRFHVILFEDPNAGAPLLDFTFNDPYDPCDYSAVPQPYDVTFVGGSTISLLRPADGNFIAVDAVTVPPNDVVSGWLTENVGARSIERDISRHKCIRCLWSDANEASFPTLGQHNNYIDPNPQLIQAHPANARFTNVGEVGMIFCKDVYGRIWSSTDTEINVRLNLADSKFQQIFNYLTVFDPSSDGINNDGDYKGAIENIDENNLNETPEWKIPGRININTAPWYVIAQLPWMRPAIAQAIVAYRNKVPLLDSVGNLVADYRNRTLATGSSKPLREDSGFESIGELATVVNKFDKPGSIPNYRDFSMRYYLDGEDQEGFPDLTTDPATPVTKEVDGAPDDFEERDVIFSRISNLVTVRSDVFTAYILVRIGADGPQKRVIAILDRSNVYSSDGKVRIIALHPVPDPR